VSGPQVSLRQRLLVLAAASIFPLAVMSGVGLLVLVQQQRQQAQTAALEIARALSTAVDAELQRAISVLEALAAEPVLDRNDIVRFHQVARRVLDANPAWLTIILADPSGKQLVNARMSYGAELPPVIERASFEAVLRTQQPIVGYLARGAGTLLATPVRVPVIRGGRIRYVLTAAVKPDGVLGVVNRQRVPADWVVSVFDAHNQRVARSRQHEEFLGGPPARSLLEVMDQSGAEGIAVTTTLEGETVYTAFTRSRMTGWTVAIGIARSYVDAAVRRSLVAYGGGILLSIALAAAAALILGRGIARPIGELRAAAQALGRREPVEVPATPIREIRQVGDSLVTAAAERARGEAERDQLLEREQRARAIAEEANRSKDEFLAMLGHELRNPLGAIANASRLLEMPDGETREHARGVIARQVQHLSRMTDDLLDAARAMTGKIVLQRQPLDLAEAAGRALSALRAGGRLGAHRVVPDLHPVWTDADATRVEQIIGNLLGNAVRFTPAGGAITVSVEREGDEAVLRVADEGVGMSPELAARVFEPFVQGERPLDRSYGGLGIGLTLVRRLAELHGGSASAESAGPGKGSVFTVRLAAMSAPAARHGEASRAAGVAPRDVLVVEDNEDARETLRRLLLMQGHRVRVASDGEAGLQALRETPPDVALIDIGLPKLDGYEIARRIVAERSGRRPYLVAVTGYGLPEDRQRTRAAGFDQHLVKPVDPALLDDVLKNA